MKLIIKVLLFINLLIAEDGKFRIKSDNLEHIIYSSSLWLTSVPSIDPLRDERFIFQAGFSSIKFQKYNKILLYPNIDVGLKITKNLAITYKSYGFISGNDSPQVLGGGLQYYFGNNDTLDWSVSIHRADLNGLKHYNLKSITMDLRKWLSIKNMRIRIGIGSNVFKERSILNEYDIPTTLEGQTNFIGLNMLYPIARFIFGIELKVGPQTSHTSIFLQKEIF